MMRNQLARVAAALLLLVLAAAGQTQADQQVATGELILSRLDLARLSQLRLELRKLEPVRRCAILQQELGNMLGPALMGQSPNAVFGMVGSVLHQRQLPFQNSQPVLEDLELCGALVERGQLAPSSLNLPLQREVIASPPLREPLQVTPNHMQAALNEFQAVRGRTKDVGQDLYRVSPVQNYGGAGSNPAAALDHANQAIARDMNRIQDTIQDVVEDAADGRLDGIKSGYRGLDPHAQHRLEREMGAIADEVQDLVDGAAEGTAHYPPPAAGYHAGGGSSHYQTEGAGVAHRAVERGLERLQDKLEDMVEDAADGRLDGRKDFVAGGYGGASNGALEHAKRVIRDGVDNIQHNMRNIAEDAADGHLDGYVDHRGPPPPMGYHQQVLADPHYEAELRRQEEARHAKRVIERQVDHLEHKLKDVVEDAADGSLDGIKAGAHHQYPVGPGYGLPPAVDYHQQEAAKRVIEGQMDHLEHHLKDIVDDASDGHVDGIKGHLPPYNPYHAHHQAPYAGAPHYDASHRGYLQGEANRRRLEKTVDRLEEAIEDANHLGGGGHGGHLHAGYPPHAGYLNSGVDAAKRVIERQVDHLEHKLKDVVDDAADGRLDGIKSRHRLPPGPIDPRSLPTEREMKHAQRQAERRIDHLQARLHGIVEDASEGRFRSAQHAHHGHHAPVAYKGGHGGSAAYGANSHTLNKIRDTLDDLAEDAADGRIDGMKSRLGFPNSRHHYAGHLQHQYAGGHSSGGSISRMLGRGLDKLGQKLHEGTAAGYELAPMLRDLHQTMAYHNQHESQPLRCDRFSALLSSSPMSRDQVLMIARQPLNKLATGRPLAEARPVLQAALADYGHLFLGAPDHLSRALGDELLTCAQLAATSYQHNAHYGLQHPGAGSVYASVPNSAGRLHRGVNKFRSKLGMLPFEQQLNARFPTMPAMPTIHY